MKRLFFLLSVLFVSCNTSDVITNPESLDQKLEDALIKASGNKGKTFYKFPDAGDLSGIPQDPRNPLTPEKVRLGQMLFHETALGRNPKLEAGTGTYSCASCHHAKAGFQAGIPQGIGEGGLGYGVHGEGRYQSTQYSDSEIDIQPIRTPSAMNMAYQTNILWNGQFGGTHLNLGTEANWTTETPKEKNKLGFEGVETQALAGRDVHRLIIDKMIIENTGNYKELYTAAFDAASLNDPVVLKNNGALAIAAYERSLLANESPFQLWLRGNTNALTDDEKEGAILFFGKAECSSCHNGPSLANMEFHALGMNDLHNGSYGDNQVVGITNDKPEHKGRGGFTGRDEDMFKFKVPQLYNLTDSPFFGHGASFNTVKDVILYKNAALAENAKVPVAKLDPAFKPLGLSETEIDQITAFIEKGLHDPNLDRYVPAAIPSGFAFPNNDAQSRIDLGF